MKKLLSKKISKNISWLFFDKLFRASLNFLIIIFLARYLEPEKFGLLSYLLSLLLLFTSASSLGLNPVLVNKFVKTPKNLEIYLANGYFLRFFSSLLSYFLFIVFIIIFHVEFTYTKYSLILGMCLVFKSSEILFSYFESKTLSKKIVISQLYGLLILFILQLIVIYFRLNIDYIIWTFLAEALVVAFFINIFFFSKNFINFKLISMTVCKKLLKLSFPVLFSTISIIVYMRIDQVMIQNMLGNYNVGTYSVSVRLIEAFHFLPKIIIISFLPYLLKISYKSRKLYEKKLINLNFLTIYFSLFLVLLIYFFSDVMVNVFFGINYLESIDLVRLSSISILFVYIGVVNEHWYVNNNLQKYYAINVALGALCNIILNYYLINIYGLKGAVYATIISYMLMIFVFDIFNSKTKHLLLIKYKSFFK